MATTSRTATSTPDATALAESLREASFVRVCSHADGESLASSASLARAFDEIGVPFQVSVVRTEAAAERRVASDDDDSFALALGCSPGSADESVTAEERASVTFDVVRALDVDPDPILSLASQLAGGHVPAGDLLAAAEEEGVERRPGVGLPVADLADGLAHSTLLHAGFSGDENAAGATLAELGLPVELDESAWRTLASVVALEATDTPDAKRAAQAVERALHPHVLPDGPFETAEGYADVLCALAREAPGQGVAFALGAGDRADVLDTWREHARRAHTALRLADPTRYSGLVTATVEDADPWTVARLLRDFRSQEPIALVLGDGDAALATTDVDAREVLAEAAATEAASEAADAVGGTARLAYAELSDDVDLVSAVREGR